MYVHVRERDVFAKPGGGFSPFCSALEVKVTSKDTYFIILDSVVFFNRIYCNLAQCKVLLTRINAFGRSIAVTG